MDSWMCKLPVAAVGCHLSACCWPGGGGILVPRHGLPPFSHLPQDPREEAYSLFAPCHASELVCRLDVTFPAIFPFYPVGWRSPLHVTSMPQPVRGEEHAGLAKWGGRTGTMWPLVVRVREAAAPQVSLFSRYLESVQQIPVKVLEAGVLW